MLKESLEEMDFKNALIKLQLFQGDVSPQIMCFLNSLNFQREISFPWVLGWSVMWAAKELTKRRKCREWSFHFYLSNGGKGLGSEKCASSSPEGLRLCVYIGNRAVAGQDISVGLQLVSTLSLGAGSGGWSLLSDLSCFVCFQSLYTFRVLPAIF